MKVKIRRSTIYATIIIILIIAGLAYKYFSGPSDTSIVTGAAIACDSPYMRHGDGCCLDSDANKICDDDESITESSEIEEGPELEFPPIKIKNMKIEGNDLKPHSVNSVSGKQGEKIRVDVTFEAEETASNIEIELRLSGNEEDSTVITARSEPFSVKGGVTYTKTFYPVLPTDVRDDYYKMDIEISCVCTGKVMQTYRIRGRDPQHIILFHDFWFEPDHASGGSNVTAFVDIENKGQAESNVKISISVPYLNAGAYTYIDMIEKYTHQTYKIALPIPAEAPDNFDLCSYKNNIKDCDYTAQAKVWFGYQSKPNSYLESVRRNAPIHVTFE